MYALAGFDAKQYMDVICMCVCVYEVVHMCVCLCVCMYQVIYMFMCVYIYTCWIRRKAIYGDHMHVYVCVCVGHIHVYVCVCIYALDSTQEDTWW